MPISNSRPGLLPLIFALLHVSAVMAAGGTDHQQHQPSLASAAFVDRGACPFECCEYTNWIAKREIAVHQEMSEASPVIYTEEMTGQHYRWRTSAQLRSALLCVGLILSGCVTDPVLRQAISEASANPGPAIAKLRPFAEEGNIDAIVEICVAYGRSIDSSAPLDERKRAFEWCRTAARSGSAASQYHLGNFHAWGIGTTEDRSAALQWYRQAASQGHVAAEDAARALEGKPSICRNPITGCRLM
ncbi:tetratricopeptide repeat protein [uncultured Thiodictyon sp.]|jgi:hypothetical protein|uniref:tetratricopeptide repeat protein n=1 Tax=uncultured Thiodictyon sp. TaxID=1846217 RepID=UPI0025D0D325|nr:tetratricopeptide repeat protein [uncultured Thiodictyon sp.]